MDAKIYDVVVVGGGAAGLCAALVLALAPRQVAVVDAGEPRNARQLTCRCSCPATGCRRQICWTPVGPR